MNIRIVCSFFVLLGCSQAIHVQGQETDPGFINIDCGAASDYYDDNLQLHHATDDKYVDSGKNMQPQLQLLSRLGDNNQQLRNLRSFPNGKRNCYTLKPTNAKNTTFLIRASFYYGNYDGKNQTPVFDLHIGVNYWTAVNSTYNHYEIEYTSLNDSIEVCLINTGNGTPFISDLRLRMLDNSIYRLGDASLILVWRFNVGSSLYYRHPSDPFDRIWEPKIYDHLVSIKSNSNNLVDNNEYRVPGEVLMNAQKAVDSNSSLILSGSLTDVQRWYILFHFTEVEILPNNTKREFNIYVNNEPALTNPIRLEYLKPLTVASPIVTGLWIDVSINPTDNTNPYPPILNAIEYFTVLEHRDVSTFINDGNARHVIIIVTASVGPMVLLFIALAIICKIRRSKTGQGTTGQGATGQGTTGQGTTGQGARTIEFRTRRFSFSEVLKITDNLTTVIGEGGFGKVYHGKHGDMEVAVKLLFEKSKQAPKLFQAEAELLMGLSHKNLVSLVGFCDEDEKMVLIYEFMTNGDLKQHLSSERGPNVLSWTHRVRIALDIAQGLDYLHNGCKIPIIHRDLKPANILLNGSMQAKIADFGLSKAFKTEHDTHITTSKCAGTYGYMDPEFHAPGGLKKESDIYSFGIILFELVTGYHPFRSGPDRNSVGWVFPFIENGDIQSIVDNRLNGDFNINTARKVVDIAVACVKQSWIQRPDISSILAELKECWEIEVSAAGNNENMLIEPSNKAVSGGVLEDDVPSPR